MKGSTRRPAKSDVVGILRGLAKRTPTSSSPSSSSATTMVNTARPQKVSTGAYLTQRWLPAQRSQLKATTFDSYRRTIELHVLPALGAVQLARLTPEDLDTLYARLLESGRRNTSGHGPGLSAASVRYVHRILHKALADAVRKGSLVRNPADRADPPKRTTSKTPRPEMRVWNAAQLQIFLGTVEQERLGRALVLSAHTGMRRGEVMGLRWSDVDLEARLIHVRQSATVVAYELRIADVKTSYGRRTIDVNGDVVDALPRVATHAARGTAARRERLRGPRPRVRQGGRAAHPSRVAQPCVRTLSSGGAAYRSSGCTTFGTRTPRCC